LRDIPSRAGSRDEFHSGASRFCIPFSQQLTTHRGETFVRFHTKTKINIGLWEPADSLLHLVVSRQQITGRDRESVRFRTKMKIKIADATRSSVERGNELAHMRQLKHAPAKTVRAHDRTNWPHHIARCFPALVVRGRTGRQGR
jgi:hypothetical protein